LRLIAPTPRACPPVVSTQVELCRLYGGQVDDTRTDNRYGDADLAAVGSVLADPARAKVLLALADGRSLPASVLAREAGVAASTASHHLGRLVDAGLLAVTTRGKYRYFTLAGPQVGALIEAVGRVAPTQPITSLRQGTRAHAVRYARCCYDHLAGRLGVAVTDAMRGRDLITGSDGSVSLDRIPGPRPAGLVVDAVGYTVTDQGVTTLAALGISTHRCQVVRCCVDWTEQRHHIAGPLGRAMLDRFLELGWLTRMTNSRAVHITADGRTRLIHFGVAVP
jgi:DNA-binding transcriptional ArsR family regulator